MSTQPTAHVDRRFGEPDAGPTPWTDTERALQRAELYWLTTVRADGRPHVTPLIGLWRGSAAYFCTGLREQKARNLEHSRNVVLTTGCNRWASGLDVVVEGIAVRISGREALGRIADGYEAKYGSAWHFEVDENVFGTGERAAAVFRIEPTKVMAFAKGPHAQTTYRFTSGSRDAKM
jgi:nitroimidazol reductase NimA-like FMN-containing flavoprotein (pyridoxamine 5'-phosphate oxidase superfamily)